MNSKLLLPLQRLEIYQNALADYENPEITEGLKKGFCFYFWFHLDLDVYLDDTVFEKMLPELYSTKPSKFWIWVYDGYWFKQGNRRKRISSLKKAIELTTKKL